LFSKFEVHSFSDNKRVVAVAYLGFQKGQSLPLPSLPFPSPPVPSFTFPSSVVPSLPFPSLPLEVGPLKSSYGA